ncbi:hypothetical protein [Thiolapillus sp.]|uniref:hypothetical protein n=1 Tax=Thiolapillus sp. TaxID=2017437 RepID=UPI0034D3DD6C
MVFVGRIPGVLAHSNSKGWINAFDAMASLKPKVIVPGHGPVTDLAQARKDTRDYLVPVYKCQVIEIQLKNRKKTMRNPVQDGTIMI